MMNSNSPESQSETPGLNPKHLLSPSGPPPGFGQAINEYLNQYVAVADTKASILMGAALLIAGFLLTHDSMSVVERVNRVSAVIFGLASSVGAVVTLPKTPRLKNGTAIFWGDICDNSTAEEYIKELSKLDEKGVEVEFAKQNFLISRVLQRKYRLLRISVVLFIVASVGAATGLLLESF